jgi:hypothetical protein
MEKHYSLVVADELLNQLLKDPEVKDAPNVSVCTFHNGREQGYSLTFLTVDPPGMKAISFAQQRSSDDIVVYYGPEHTQGLSEEAYNNAKYFGFGEYQEAHDYICSILVGEMVRSNIM